MHRGTLRRLRVVGAGKAPAEISFHPTLTFLTGASNTGKSHIFGCIDFCLGGTTPEHDFDEARGYDRALLELGTNGAVTESCPHWASASCTASTDHSVS